MKKEDIINAYLRMREIDNTIPDEVLDFMKDASLKHLNFTEKNLLQRVQDEAHNYSTAEHAAIDHLKMAHSHMFEETEGRDLNQILSNIEKLTQKIESIMNS